MEIFIRKTMPGSRENTGVVHRSPDRPAAPTVEVHNPNARRIVGSRVEASLTPVQKLDRGIVIGGGTSDKSLREARKRLANGHH